MWMPQRKRDVGERRARARERALGGRDEVREATPRRAALHARRIGDVEEVPTPVDRSCEAGSTLPPAGTFTWSENDPSVIACEPSISLRPASAASSPATAPSPKLNMKRERSFP